MKTTRILLTLGLIAALLTACSGAGSDEAEAISVLDKAIHIQYDVKHRDIPEDHYSMIKERGSLLKPLVTGELLDKLEANMDTAMPVRIAAYNKADLEATVTEMKIEAVKDAKDSYDLKYTVVVKVTEDSGKVQPYSVPGEATAVRTAEDWVLSRLWSDYRWMAKLYP
ncbi:hypothetical protein [Paenibacillus sp. P22]|uniref:hypothetical protein n=1 Tax=Paenibacillus sp. P22 TaxID=483908 RepID=UPI0004355846|nr:hypothetical protein [Paenibacillus sp. P22]CDN42230.1 hypothetical protein BN871_BA_00050 [Paenibacillus sp. P22]